MTVRPRLLRLPIITYVCQYRMLMLLQGVQQVLLPIELLADEQDGRLQAWRYAS